MQCGFCTPGMLALAINLSRATGARSAVAGAFSRPRAASPAATMRSPWIATSAASSAKSNRSLRA
ncbi:hypothetical protein ACNJPY_21165 [Mycobacterium tuberculosis]